MTKKMIPMFVAAVSVLCAGDFDSREKAFDEATKKDGKYLKMEEIAKKLNEGKVAFGKKDSDYVVCYSKKHETLVHPKQERRGKTVDEKEKFAAVEGTSGSFTGKHISQVVDGFFAHKGSVVSYGLGTEKDAKVIGIDDDHVCALVFDKQKPAASLDEKADAKVDAKATESK